MITEIVYIITAFMDAYLAYSISESILMRNANRKYHRLGFFILFPMIILGLNRFVDNTFLRVLLGSFFYVVCTWAWFDGDGLVKVFSGALFASILFVGDIFIYGIVLYIYPDYFVEPSEHAFLVGSIAFYTYIALVILIVKRFPQKALGKLSRGQGLLLALMPMASASVITLLVNYFKKKEIYDYYMFLLPAAFFMLILVFTIAFFSVMATNAHHARMQTTLNNQIESVMTNFETLEHAYRAIRGIKHDWKNHTLVLDNLIQQKNWDELSDYVQDSKTILNDGYMSLSGNVTIDVLLNHLINRAKDSKIEIETCIRITHDIAIRRIDLCVLLSNAFDNAVEACQSADLDNRKIVIKMSTKPPYLYLSVKNTFGKQPRKVDGRYVTIKITPEAHGIGISNMESIVAKYDGYISLKNTEDTFSVRCILKNEITDCV